MSVDNKNEEKDTAGIKKNAVAVHKAIPASLHSIFVSIKIKYDDMQYNPTGIIFITKKLFPKIKMLQTYGLSEVGILRSKSKSSNSLWVKIGGEGFLCVKFSK